MQKWNAQGGIFTAPAVLINQRCYAMKRIAFLIFSCADDEFINQLDPLMKKMIDVIKKREPTNRDIKQRIFVFFLTRVMLIRLNTQTLTEALRKLWPHLLSELISVFETRSIDVEAGTKNNMIDRENADLTIEAIKLVELLSSLNIEDFQMNQWIFLIDGYGMRREEDNISGFGSSPSRLQESSRPTHKRTTSRTATMAELGVGEVFRTFIVHFMGDVTYSFYNVEQDRHQQSEEEHKALEAAQMSASPGSAMLQGHDGSMIDEKVREASDAMQNFQKKLEKQACELQLSINRSNVEGNEFNRQEAETLIEKDFETNDIFLKMP